jgi:hypothetical protein
MDFDELLRSKIAARQSTRSAAALSEELLRQRALDRIRPLYDAVVEMAGRLGRNPVFARAVGGRPKVVLSPVKSDPNFAALVLHGETGIFRFVVHHSRGNPDDTPGDSRTEFAIDPDLPVRRALRCGWTYAESIPVHGTMNDVAGFIVAVEDMIAEYLADLCTSPLGHKFLPDGY